MVGVWRKLHNEKLEKNDQVKEDDTVWEKHVACMERKKIAYGILVGKPEGRRLPGRPGSVF
jgi:hypothetical protein